MLRTRLKYRNSNQRRDMPLISYQERRQRKDQEYRRKSFGAHQDPHQGRGGRNPPSSRRPAHLWANHSWRTRTRTVRWTVRWSRRSWTQLLAEYKHAGQTRDKTQYEDK